MIHARGQAVVEAALGTLVFVTILIFGIHFAELGHLQLKVQEAANAAIWDSTSQQMHDVTAHQWTQHTAAVAFADVNANARYADFDGLRSRGTTTTLVFTQAQNMRVNCRTLVAADGLAPNDPDPLAAGTYPIGNRGITCAARADLTGFRIPTNFLDGNMSNATHYRPLVIPACAVGRPVRGNCPGRLGMLLDDWGYVGPAEARECALAWEGGSGCANQGYDQALNVYQATAVPNVGAASRLAAVVAGGSPIDEDFFFMSFRGMESPFGPFQETVQSSHGDLLWETTPYQHPRNNRYDRGPHTNCWLGNLCR